MKRYQQRGGSPIPVPLGATVGVVLRRLRIQPPPDVLEAERLFEGELQDYYRERRHDDEPETGPGQLPEA